MRKMKQFLSILLVAVMMLAMNITAFAAGETGSITINDADIGQTYTVYRILELEGYHVDNQNTGEGQYAYKATTAWSSFINSDAIKGNYVNVDAQGYVTWKEGASVADFAKLAQKYAADNSLTNQGSTTATSATVTFNNLDLGYYLVDSSLGTLCSLDTTNPDVIMEEKNEAPTNEKKVEEDSTNSYDTKNDADIGQTVNFQSTITAQAGAENYVFHDKMDAGLTFGSVTGITLNGTTVDNTNNVAYTVSTSPTDGDTFDVTFTKTFCDTLKANDKIVISYTATVNENAVIGSAGNKNESKIEYGEQGKTTTTPGSTTTTYTWDLDVFKYAQDGQDEKPLAGATFTLSKSSDGTNPIKLVSKGNNVYRVATATDTTTITEITTDATGKFTIEGLDADTYYLTEKAAPAGYNKLADAVKVVIGENGVVNATTDAPQGVSEVKILNQTGSELPSTGGMGTTIFYVVGGILLVGATVLLIVKKRMSVEKER